MKFPSTSLYLAGALWCTYQ